MNEDLKNILTSLGADTQAMEADGLTAEDYKSILKQSGADVDMMESDGLFGAPQEPKINLDLSTPTDNIVQTEVPGTVIPEDTTSTMSLPEVDQSNKQVDENIDTAGQFFIGMRRDISLPLAKMMEDGLRSIGIDAGDTASKDLDKANKLIKEYNDAHPDQFIHPSTAGGLVGQLAVPAMKTKKAIAATEGLLMALQGIGENNNYEHVALDATIGATLGVVGAKLFEGGGALYNHLMRDPRLSKEAHYLLRRNPKGLTKEQLINLPKEDQVYLLARSQGKSSEDLVNNAIKDMDYDAQKIALKQSMQGNTQAILDPFKDADIVLENASRDYNKIADKFLESNVKFDTTLLEKDIAILDDYMSLVPNKTAQVIRKLRGQIERGDLDLSNVIRARKELTAVMNKAKGDDLGDLMKITDKFDEFMKANMTKAQYENSQILRRNYREAIRNVQTKELIESNIDINGLINWGKLKEELKDPSLSSADNKYAIDIAEQMFKVFKNDQSLGAFTNIKGVSSTSHSIIRLWSELTNFIANKALWGHHHDKLAIQKGILNSLKGSNNYNDFVKNIRRNKYIPKELVNEVDDILKIEYKPEITKSANDINLTPIYGTNKGTLGNNMSEITLKDRQDKLISDFVTGAINREDGYRSMGITMEKAKNIQENEIVDKFTSKIHKYMENKRLERVAEGLVNRIKNNSDNEKAFKVAQIVESETNRFMKELKRDTGMNLPEEESKELVEMFINDFVKNRIIK